MKKWMLAVLVVVLLSLAFAPTAYADPPPGKACPHITGSGWFLMRGAWRQYLTTGSFQGRFYGPVVGYHTVCR